MPRVCAPLRILQHGGHAKRNVRQPHVSSVQVPIVNILRYQLPMKAKLSSKRPMQRIQDRTTNEAEVPRAHYGYRQHSTYEKTPVTIQARRYEDGNQQERM